MTKRILIDGKIYNREDLVFLDGGRRIEWRNYLGRIGKPGDTGLSVNEREDGSLISWQDVPDGLSREEENAKMQPAFLKLTNEIEAASREVQGLANTLRMVGAQGGDPAAARNLAYAAAKSVRALADRILNAGGAAFGITMEPLCPGAGSPRSNSGGE